MGSYSGSALVMVLLIMSALLAYSVHVLHSSSCLYEFACSRAHRINYQCHLNVAYQYGCAFCKQYHRTLQTSTDAIQVVIAPETQVSPYTMHLSITPSKRSYVLHAQVKKASQEVASGEKVILFEHLSM